MPKLTHEQLTARLRYDPATGKFTRVVSVRQYKAGTESGCYAKSGYVIVCINRRNYMAHVLAWFYAHAQWPHGEIDHRNGVRADNRLENLRDVPLHVNAQNKRKAMAHSTTGLLGVCRNRKKFLARIKRLDKVTHLGTYDTAEEAHAAYVAAKREMHEGCTL